MTDTLLKPEDTGDIRLPDPGATTRNLAGYALNPPPMNALRMVDATGEIPRWYNGGADGGCRTVVPEDAPDEFTTAPTEPPKLPPPPPPAPKVDVLVPTLDEVEYARQGQTKARYAPRHRAKGHWYTPLVDGIAIGWDVCRRSM